MKTATVTRAGEGDPLWRGEGSLAATLRSLALSYKVKHTGTPPAPAIPQSTSLLKGTENFFLHKICIQTLTEVLLIIANNWKQPRQPSISAWAKNRAVRLGPATAQQ